MIDPSVLVHGMGYWGVLLFVHGRESPGAGPSTASTRNYALSTCWNRLAECLTAQVHDAFCCRAQR
jgi:hypothetical protein